MRPRSVEIRQLYKTLSPPLKWGWKDCKVAEFLQYEGASINVKRYEINKKIKFFGNFSCSRGCSQTKYQTITSYIWLKSSFYKEQLLIYDFIN